jgi:hypothetical protein
MNFKRIITLGLVAGMLAVSGTACSSNTVDRNQGNRNGQRVADAVNHRPDSYNGRENTRGTTRGLFGRTTRGLNRATRNIGTTAREVTDGISSRYTRTPNRANTFARPPARIGGNYRYEMNHTERGIPRSGINRAARRANRANINNVNNVNGIGIANDATVPVFFNKKAAPVQPETAPAPVEPAPAQ